MYHKVERLKQTKQNPDGIISKGYTASLYVPTKEESDVTKMVQDDMSIGRQILTKSWMWYNGRSILQEMEENQKRFNSYIPPKSDDPDESWRANTVRPLTRNKLISIAAHVTARMLYPAVFAQNNKDEEDRAASEVIRDCVEWAIENSEYKMKFIGSVMGALTDPVSVMEAGFAKVMRTVREKQIDGSYTEQEIVDELLSGFVQNYRQCNEVYITNAFENNIQKQRAVGVRTLIDYSEAEALYGKHKNWKSVTCGVRQVFDPISYTFYEVSDPDMIGNFVERVVYRNRYKDLELVFINGILVTDHREPISRKDKMYGLAAYGYEFLNNGNFFYYKSAVNKLAPDQDVIDTMYNMVMDGSFMALMPPGVLFGSEEITSSMMVPGTVTSFKDTNTKFEALNLKSDTRTGMETISLLEKSMSESSQDGFQQGIMTPGERTAQEIETIQSNARIALGLFGKMMQNFVRQIGVLMVGDVVQYLAVGEVAEITSEGPQLKFKTLLLNDKIVNGKKVTKKLRFTDKTYNSPTPTHEDLMNHSMDLLDEEDASGSTMAIYDINPEEFRKLKFLVTIGSDTMVEKSEQLEKALNLEAYDRLIQSPVISRDPDAQDAVTRDFLLEVFAPGDADKYMPKAQPANPPIDAATMGEAVASNTPNQFNQKGVNTNLTQQITGGTSVKKLMRK